MVPQVEFFGRIEDTKKTFQNQLTYSSGPELLKMNAYALGYIHDTSHSTGQHNSSCKLQLFIYRCVALEVIFFAMSVCKNQS